MPLGLMPSMAYEVKETMLLASVLFYSDGLIEAHNPEHEMCWAPPGVREIVKEHAPGAKRLTARVVEELGRFTGEWWEQEDDITLVTLERLAAKA
jgi:serine phosphatase RsbU (regulator of sigma subunit)